MPGWYTRALGSLHLARSGIVLATTDSPLPRLRVLSTDELLQVALEDLLADLNIPDRRSRASEWLEAYEATRAS